ncbi:integrase, catalytic region, zinc finger, CCHC-type containing protein [Tanacetum coccineum]
MQPVLKTALLCLTTKDNLSLVIQFLGDANRAVSVNETFHEQTDDELTEKELKQVEADDQAIQTILLGIPEDIYAAVDSYYTQLYDFLKYTQKEVYDLRAERFAKTHDPLAFMANSKNPFNYQVFHQDQPSSSTYMQQLLPNNNYNLQPSFNQNYMQQPMPNPKDITDPTTAMNMALVLMAKAFKLNYSTPTNNNQRISSNPRNRQIAQPGMNMGQDRQMRMVGANGGNQFRQYAGQNVGYQNGYNAVQNVGNRNLNGNVNVVAARAKGNAIRSNCNQIRCYNCRGLGHLARNCTVRPRRRDAAYLQTQLLIAQKEEAGIQLQAEEFDLMAAAADLDEIEEVNANCILMANLQQASTSGTQTDKAPVYDSDGSAEVHNYDNCYDNEIFNMFTQEEQYTELLEPIPEPHQVQQNDSNVISDISSVEQEGGTVDQHPATVEETRAYFESLYNNLALEVEKQAQQKQQSLYNGKILLEKHDPPVVYDSEETLELAQESRLKMKQLNKEIKPRKLHKRIIIFRDFCVLKTSKSQRREAAKFVRDFKSLAKEADESLAKHKTLELEIGASLEISCSSRHKSICAKSIVVEYIKSPNWSFDRTKEHLENCYH